MNRVLGTLNGLSGVYSGGTPPYYGMVPKGIRQNLCWRKALIEEGQSDPKTAAVIRGMCRADPLFWINTFAWGYDPRLIPDDPVSPFVTYPYQDESVLALFAAMGVGEPAHDLLVEKSRDMGASWMCVLTHLWFWMFRDMVSFLWVSRKEDLVDKAGNPDCLFWKADFTISKQPTWLRPAVERQHCHLLNLETGSVIDGETTTGDVGAGGRRTSILLDEFARVREGQAVLAATADVTRSRLFNSTPQGPGNAFFLMRESNIRKLRLHWTLHPEKSAGKYMDAEGNWRSPWYDAECQRRTKQEIAEELDIDYYASGSTYFDAETLMEIQRRDVRPPYLTGEVRFTVENERLALTQPMPFEVDPRGRLALWTTLVAGKPPADRDYVLGCDVSAGSDASNSVVSIVDALTGEKVGEFVTTDMPPHEFGRYAVALATLFGGKSGGGYLVWEENGPGQVFGKTVVGLGWRRVYYRRDESRLRRKRSDKLGWFATREGKVLLLGEFRKHLELGTYTERSMSAVQEARNYTYGSDGVPVYAPSLMVIDPSGARQNHGDRIVANALACMGLGEVKAPEVDFEQTVPANCFYARQQRRLKAMSDDLKWAVN